MLSKLSDLLLEEPKKLQKLGILLSKSVLILLFASWLFKMLVGNYNLIDIDSFSQWAEFLLSGQLLLCCLFFFLSYLILFELFGSLVYLIFNTMLTPKPVGKLDYNAFNGIVWALRKFKILDYDRDGGEIRLLERSEDLRDFTTFFTHQEARKEINAYKSSLLSEIGLTYLVFVLIYFIVLEKVIHNVNITILVICGFLVLIFAYWFLSLILELLHKLAPALSEMLDTATFETIVKNTFDDEGYTLIAGEKILQKYKFIQLDEQKAAILVNVQPKNQTKYLLKQYKDIVSISDNQVWIFTKKEIHPKVKEALLVKPDLIQIINFNDEADLTNKIKECLKKVMV